MSHGSESPRIKESDFPEISLLDINGTARGGRRTKKNTASEGWTLCEPETEKDWTFCNGPDDDVSATTGAVPEEAEADACTSKPSYAALLADTEASESALPPACGVALSSQLGMQPRSKPKARQAQNEQLAMPVDSDSDDMDFTSRRRLRNQGGASRRGVTCY